MKMETAATQTPSPSMSIGRNSVAFEGHHPTAEQIVIAAMCRNETFAIDLHDFDPANFEAPIWQVVCEAVHQVVMGVEPLDPQAIVSAARSIARDRKLQVNVTEEIINGLAHVDTARARPYAATVARYAWLRQVNQFSQWIQTEIADCPDPDDLFAAAQERIMHLQPKTKQQTFVYGFDTLAAYDALMMERIRAQAKGEAVIFDWPWKSWNAIVRPLRPGLAGVLAAPDGVGKSSALEMVAEHWATKANVVFVHLENDLDYTLDRRMCRHSRLPMGAIEDGTFTPDQHKRAQTAARQMENFAPRLHYFDASGKTMPEIIAELQVRRAEGVCDAVVMDYLNKVRPTRAQSKLFGDDGFGRQADNMEQFKSFAVKYKVPVLTATQMNKEGQMAGRQTRKNIRGSGEISEKSQLVIVMTRAVLEHELTDIRGQVIAQAGEYSPVMKVRIDKQNRGKTGEFEQLYNGACFEIRDKS